MAHLIWAMLDFNILNDTKFLERIIYFLRLAEAVKKMTRGMNLSSQNDQRNGERKPK